MVEKDTEIFQDALAVITEIYGTDRPKRPGFLHKSTATLKSSIKTRCKSASFLGEFPSALPSEESASRLEKTTIAKAVEVQEKLFQLIREGYQLKRIKATEAVVFICSDLDRKLSKHPLRWAPICWFPKGYSLNTETMRSIYEKVMNECHRKGLHVPAVSFDGQWHNIAVRSVQNKPLTILQLQKDVWKESERIQKTEIIKMFENLNKSYHADWIENPEGDRKAIVCYGDGTALPKTSGKG